MDILLFIFLLVLLVVNFFLSTAIASAAANRGRSFNVFFWISFLLSPLVGAVALLAIWSATSGVEPMTLEEYTDCPMCAEKILKKAKLCKHCGSEVSSSTN